MNRRRASKTKSAIHEISKRLARRGCNSSDIVAELRKPDYIKIIEEERDDLIEIGLKVLAGRVTSKPIREADEASLFPSDEVPKEFIELKFAEGTFEGGRFRILDISLEMWDAQETPHQPRQKRKSQFEILRPYFDAMRQKGLPTGTTLEQFLRRGGS